MDLWIVVWKIIFYFDPQHLIFPQIFWRRIISPYNNDMVATIPIQISSVIIFLLLLAVLDEVVLLFVSSLWEVEEDLQWLFSFYNLHLCLSLDATICCGQILSLRLLVCTILNVVLYTTISSGIWVVAIVIMYLNKFLQFSHLFSPEVVGFLGPVPSVVFVP